VTEPPDSDFASIEPPIGLLAELSHRCPLRCGYCSNPIELVGKKAELSTEDWRAVLREAASLGVLQVHFSGGEPTIRGDLEALIETARDLDLYTNLITSGVLLDRARLQSLDRAGLDHLQLSFQDVNSEPADAYGGYAGGHERKLEVAGWTRALDIPLTLNAVIHRGNIERAGEFIALAEELDAHRIEIANVQYNGWATRNLDSLLPRPEQLQQLEATVESARERLAGRLLIDFVPPDYYARRPKACMEGWGRRFLNVSPSGRVLPCHSAETIPGMTFERVGERTLEEIWYRSDSFQRFRGEAWMSPACRSCEFREEDFGGCRCQALAIAGDAAATDPVCERSPHRAAIDRKIEQALASDSAPYLYRGSEQP
jgi:pyrroloquinoline quinone biosynthesis protein E